MRQKHVPQRTCIGCGETKAKRELVRVVRDPDGRVQIDPKGKLPGRGAYLCRRAACWEKALSKGSVTHALKASLSEEERAGLRDQLYLLQLEEGIGGDGVPAK